MDQQQDSHAGYVKKATMIQYVIIGLVVGFLGGVVLSVYKLDSFTGGQSSHNHGPAAESSQNRQSLAALEKEVEANPQNTSAWRALGNLYFDQQKHAKAIDAYKKFLELSPGDPNVLTDLGVMYRRSGQPEKAVEKFDEAVAADPKHTQAMFNKGVVLYSDLDNREGAIKSWEKIVQIKPDAKAPDGTLVSDLVEQIKQN
ncbi:MAG: tetratricopeptide repeat protein [Desulfobia sp.]